MSRQLWCHSRRLHSWSPFVAGRGAHHTRARLWRVPIGGKRNIVEEGERNDEVKSNISSALAKLTWSQNSCMKTSCRGRPPGPIWPLSTGKQRSKSALQRNCRRFISLSVHGSSFGLSSSLSQGSTCAKEDAVVVRGKAHSGYAKRLGPRRILGYQESGCRVFVRRSSQPCKSWH